MWMNHTNLRMRSWVCPNQWLEGLIPRPARVRGAELRPPFSVASKPRECPRRVGRHCPHQERAAQRWNEIHTSQSNGLWRVPNFSTVELRLLAVLMKGETDSVRFVLIFRGFRNSWWTNKWCPKEGESYFVKGIREKVKWFDLPRKFSEFSLLVLSCSNKVWPWLTEFGPLLWQTKLTGSSLSASA